MTDFREIVARRHIPSLDGLRAVAVGGVFLFHLGFLPFVSGRLGVDLFFVLSGFLITLLLLRERQTTGSISLRNFYARRALRIFPAYYVFLCVSFLAMLALGDPVTGSLVAASSTYLLDYTQAFGSHASTLVSHAWSLSVEEKFYLIWPPGLILLIRARLPLRTVTAAGMVGVLVWRIFLSHATLNLWYLYYAFDTRLDSLLIGCGLALCHQDRWLNKTAQAVSTHPVLPLLTLLLVIGIYRLRWDTLALGESLYSLLLAVLLVQGIMLHQATMWRWLSWRWVEYLGTLSYPLYLYHQLGTRLANEVPGVRFAVTLILSVAFSFALAAASYHWLERPFLRLKRAFQSDSGGATRGAPAAIQRP